MFDLTKIKAYSAASVLLLLLLLLSGVISIFSFANNLFFQLNIFQLIILSIVGIAPIFVLNILLFIILVAGDSDEGEWDDKQMYIKLNGASLFGSIFTFPVVYIPVIFNLFFPISFKTGFLISIVVEILILILLKYLGAPSKKNVNK